MSETDAPTEPRTAIPAPGDRPKGMDLTAYYAHTHPDKLALVIGDVRLTWDELNRRANKLGHALTALGITRGDQIGLMLRNCPEFLECSLASQKIRIGFIPMSFHLKGREVAYIAKNADVKAIICGEEFVQYVGPAADSLDRIVPGGLISVGPGTPAGFTRYADFVRDAPDTQPPKAPGKGAGYTMLYTSGTTGNPKGVYRDVQRGGRQATVAADPFKYSSNDTTLIPGPLYHAAPLGMASQHAALGATVVVMPRWSAKEWLRLIDAERVTTSTMVPTMCNDVSHLPADVRARYDVSSLRVITVAGAPFPFEVKKRFLPCVPDGVVFEFYGSTEMGMNTLMYPDEHMKKPGSVGRAVGANEIRILDENKNDVPVGEVGEIYCKNAALLTGYYKNEDATREGFHDGFFSVGDMGYLDEDGYLYLVDRKKDMVISGGVNIYPAETENLLHEHPAVSDVAVIGIPDERMGEILHAFVVVTPGASVTQEELLDFCMDNLADVKVPRSLEFLDQLPRSPSGKVLKRDLRKPFWEGHSTGIV